MGEDSWARSRSGAEKDWGLPLSQAVSKCSGNERRVTVRDGWRTARPAIALPDGPFDLLGIPRLAVAR